MRKTKIFISLMTVLAVTFSTFCYTYGVEKVPKEFELTKSQMTLLKQESIPTEEIDSLCRQIDAYHPTEEQVNNYIADLIAKKDDVAGVAAEPIEYERTPSGDIITEYGVIPNQDLASKWKPTKTALKSVSSLSNIADINDQSGVYYVVTSTSGHNEISAYATLPTLSNVASVDRPYQMLGMAASNGADSMYGDIGLVYFPDIKKWKGFYNVYESDLPPDERRGRYDINFSGSNSLYFHLAINTSKAVLTIRDASSWSQVCKIQYDFYTNCVPSNYSTVQLAKQITIAQAKAYTSDPLNYYTGTKMRNAKFSQTYLYTTTNMRGFTPRYCYTAYRKGPTQAAYQKVTATFNAWTDETVTISFN